MKVLILVGSLFTLILSNVASAATSIECGVLNATKNELVKSKYQFSSEDDKFYKEVGGYWQMKVGKNWLDPNPKITAKRDGAKIFVTALADPSARVGKLFIIDVSHPDFPTLEIKAIGGFAGGTTLEKMECLGYND